MNKLLKKIKAKMLAKRIAKEIKETAEDTKVVIADIEKEILPTSGDPLITLKVRHRILAALSYLCVLLLIPMFFGRKFDFVRFHARQGIVLLGFWIIGSFLFWLPYAGWLVVLLWLVLAAIGIVNVFTSKDRPLPVIGRLAA